MAARSAIVTKSKRQLKFNERDVSLGASGAAAVITSGATRTTPGCNQVLHTTPWVYGFIYTQTDSSLFVMSQKNTDIPA